MHGIAVARRWLLAVGALSCGPGCSYLFVDGPPRGHEQMRYFECSTSTAAPVIDTVFAAAYGLGAAGQIIDRHDERDAQVSGVAMLGLAVVEAASAAYGFRNTSQCDDAKKQWAERRLSQPAGTCGSDVDCKDDRVCEAGLCVQPRPPQPLPTPELP